MRDATHGDVHDVTLPRRAACPGIEPHMLEKAPSVETVQREAGTRTLSPAHPHPQPRSHSHSH